MKNKKEILDLIQACSDNLLKGGIIEDRVGISEDTVLIGPGAAFDSIAFVTLFVELEEKLSAIAGEDIYLIIDNIHEFNPKETYLTAGVLADYIVGLLRPCNE